MKARWSLAPFNVGFCCVILRFNHQKTKNYSTSTLANPSIITLETTTTTRHYRNDVSFNLPLVTLACPCELVVVCLRCCLIPDDAGILSAKASAQPCMATRPMQLRRPRYIQVAPPAPARLLNIQTDHTPHTRQSSTQHRVRGSTVIPRHVYVQYKLPFGTTGHLSKHQQMITK